MSSSGWLERAMSADDICANIESWVSSPALLELVCAFASRKSDQLLIEDLRMKSGTTQDRLTLLDRFSERWDTRLGGERFEAASLSITEDQKEIARFATKALVMHDQVIPPGREYNYIIILGCTVPCCLERTKHAAELVNSKIVQSNSIIALTGCRSLADFELRLASSVRIWNVSCECDVFDAIVRRRFLLGRHEFNPYTNRIHNYSTGNVRNYTREGGVSVSTVSAPSSEPKRRRSNTADTYSFFARRLLGSGHDQRILIVSSRITRLAQHSDALRVLALPYGVSVDTIGCTEYLQKGWELQDDAPSQCLMELRAAIQAMRRLMAATLASRLI